MHIISKKRLQTFWKKHADAKPSLTRWYNIAKKAHWRNLDNVQNDFRSGDMAGDCTVFNISGNKYRLITKIYYEQGTILIRFILTHAEYDKGVYKDDCNC